MLVIVEKTTAVIAIKVKYNHITSYSTNVKANGKATTEKIYIKQRNKNTSKAIFPIVDTFLLFFEPPKRD